MCSIQMSKISDPHGLIRKKAAPAFLHGGHESGVGNYGKGFSRPVFLPSPMASRSM